MTKAFSKDVPHLTGSYADLYKHIRQLKKISWRYKRSCDMKACTNRVQRAAVWLAYWLPQRPRRYAVGKLVKPVPMFRVTIRPWTEEEKQYFNTSPSK